MNKLELLWAIGVSVLLLMAIGWFAKLNIESAETMDLIGFGVVLFVLGFLFGVF